MISTLLRYRINDVASQVKTSVFFTRSPLKLGRPALAERAWTFACTFTFKFVGAAGSPYIQKHLLATPFAVPHFKVHTMGIA